MFEELQHTHPDAWQPAHWQYLITGEFDDPQTLGLLACLTPDACGTSSIKHLCEALKPHQKAIPPWPYTPLLDVCGTGGSGQQHYNTSTTVAMVLGALGCQVNKFGNRAVTSASGSFDFLEALEIHAVGKLNRLADALGHTNVAFTFAPEVYPSLKRLSELRQQLKQKTIFNYVGPLLNPSPIAWRVLGCSHEGIQPALAQHLLHTPSLKRAVVLRSHCGLDEWHPNHPAQALWCHANATVLEEDRLPALHSHLHPPPPSDDTTDALSNAKRFWELANGWDTESLAYHQVLQNSALALHVVHADVPLGDALNEVQQVLRCKGLLEVFKKLQRVYH
ncbi:MAG: hypothetical protein ACKO34_06160 [Vampirovibrionales bacterium]